MKLRKLTALLMAFAMTALLLTGCGASSKGVAMDMAMPEAAPMETPMMDEMKNSISANSAAGGVSANVQTGQKLIRKVHIDAET
ncbi:MAG: hypothetical protein IIX10_05340, partial [Clostridia bacterium]|nr:hypothetical protein [Clostridia bacterium]